MVTLKELENERIEKIKSLDSKQVKNYADVLIKDACKLYNFQNVTNPDERIDEITDIYNKLNEIKYLCGANFNNNLNYSLTIALTVEIQRYIVKGMNLKNYILNRWLGDILSNIHDFKLYTGLLYDLLIDFKEISDVAPTVADKKTKYVDEFKIIIMMLKDEIESSVDLIEKGFYDDDTIKNDIHELKVTIKNFADSDNEDDKLFVDLGLIPILADLIKAYEDHADIKKLYINAKADIDELFADSDNVFKKYSAEKYDATSGISFNDFMKSQPTFNIDTAELIEP